MRNLGAGTALAITYFPPNVVLPVILSMLFEQSLASLYGVILKRFNFGASNKVNRKKTSSV